MKKPINIRIDSELWADVQQFAKNRKRTATEVVERALFLHAGAGRRPDSYDNTGEILDYSYGKPASVEPGDAEEIATRDTVEHYHRCPIAGCEFSAPSPKARCGTHGRTVV